MKKILSIIFAIFFIQIVYAQQQVLVKGMFIKKSVKLKSSVYEIQGDSSFNHPVVVIEGNNIVVDFNNLILDGSNKRTPDQFTGIAILIRKGKNITIKNLKAKGYKIALMARNVEGLKIEQCDFSYNYRQHLNSTQEKEDISDWMSYHHNEKDEWLRYGAAIYLRNCNKAVISFTRVTGGQNALMMMECNNAMIYNNDFSFNSGIGLGMYKCSNNKVLYNKINFNVRGYSHGIYNRGQDSAGILIYEQSSNNLFYKNSVTHGGDGFFLWAGQYTMDTGKGGCNDNILSDNDFSYAPTNGIEATFSSNKFFRNRIFECDHGIWGGYSYNTKISNNQFRNNRIAIAIEHGQENVINHNIFFNDKTAIRLWARAKQPADWAYAKNRDTRSRNYIIAANSFNRNNIVYDLNRTDSLAEFGNLYSGYDTLFRADSSLLNVDPDLNETMLIELSKDEQFQVPVVKNPQNPFKNSAPLAGRKNIMITEWGPYDFGYPIIWNTNPLDTSLLQFEVWGPKGKWDIVSVRGLDSVSNVNGSLPSKFTAKRKKESRTDIEIRAVYKGESFIDQFGYRIPDGQSHEFVFRKFFQPIDFVIKWYGFDSANHPLKQQNLQAWKDQQEFRSDTVNKLDYAWWGGIKSGGKQWEQFLTIAEGRASLEPGEYEMGLTWDDAVRVFIDGKLVVDEWNPSKYIFDESPHRKIRLTLGGSHHFRVEHVELGGFATLSLKLKKLN